MNDGGKSKACASCRLSQNIIKSLKQRLEKVEEIQKLLLEQQGNEIKNLKQNILQLKSEHNICLKQKDDKISSLENALKNKIQKINYDNENKIEKLNVQLKTRNAQKEEKINFLDEKIKKCFIKIKNKWSEIDSKCCLNNCINTKNPLNKCIEGNGFGNLINDENIKYELKNGEGCNRIFLVNAENSFNKPRINFNYFLYYFEVKCKFEGKLENKDGRRLVIGLKNLIKNRDIFYCGNEFTIYIEDSEPVELETCFNDNDVFGCGLVYPPFNKLNEFPYIFFTQNGKQIGKAILLKTSLTHMNLMLSWNVVLLKLILEMI
uniref:Uncharacterized protein n=1 Tax=Meloidogyne enterolobii TaxID=390850 RepID=A0A6V7V1S3_MELEN|nr:unnamed protein product [Meloidogyne enterolobii]